MKNGRSSVNRIETAVNIAAWISLIIIQSALAGDLLGSEKEVISRAVMAQLQDPESARFKWVPFVIPRAEFYCGLVNSKDRDGGYTGDMLYFAYLTWQGNEIKTAIIAMLGDGDSESPQTIKVWRLCETLGHDNLGSAEEESCDAFDEELLESCEVGEDGRVKEETCIVVCCRESDQCHPIDSVNPR